MQQGAKQLVRPLALRLGTLAAPRRITAMVRVRNEEQFLDSSIRSIVDIVDEVVIVDNMSDDTTPAIIAALVRDYPGKVKSFVYPHQIARYGVENEQLAATPGGLESPRLLANFYNWCLAKCSHLFILKWDGDTIATAAFGRMIDKFRKSSALFVWHTGANLHADGVSLIAGRPYETSEPRLFFRRFAYYDNSLGYCEMLQSRYERHTGERYIERYDEPVYVHMKFCKSDRFTNMSDDRRSMEQDNDRSGEIAPSVVLDAVKAWNLAPQANPKVKTSA
jgi:glycosyltransferase involved in cell wall biosynthesis